VDAFGVAELDAAGLGELVGGGVELHEEVRVVWQVEKMLDG
jgi:hypothetical protein